MAKVLFEEIMSNIRDLRLLLFQSTLSLSRGVGRVVQIKQSIGKILQADWNMLLECVYLEFNLIVRSLLWLHVDRDHIVSKSEPRGRRHYLPKHPSDRRRSKCACQSVAS